MTGTTFLPPVPRPPNDPTWWLLNARVGWQNALLQGVEQMPDAPCLALAPALGSGRTLGEPSGSFGGLTIPSNVALAPDGSIYLLGTTAGLLRRFDPCACRFDTVPCLGGIGTGARQVFDPHGIGICAGNLFVCDTGNHRLDVFSLRGFVLRAVWHPPASAEPLSWEPYAVAFDGRGRVYVADPANGCVHRFSPAGIWQTSFTGLGVVRAITLDCADCLYIAVDGDPNALVLDPEGKPAGAATRPAALRSRFPCPPFPVDAQGTLDLSCLCVPPTHGCPPAPPTGVFDLHGNPVSAATAVQSPAYMKSGQYLSNPLDSALYRCQWHRVILHGDIPAGTSIQVRTFTSEVDQPLATIVQLPDESWDTVQTAASTQDGDWDCLIRSGPGRYLWLRLDFHGTGAITPAIASIKVEFPRISLARHLPAVFRADPVSGDFTDRFLGIFDTTVRGIERTVDEEAKYFDPLATPSTRDRKTGLDFLSWLATWIGVVLDRQWPETKRRRLLQRAVSFYRIRGTREGLHRQFLFYLGMEPETRCCPSGAPRSRCRPAPRNCAPIRPRPCTWQPPPLILEHYQLRRWLFVGAGRLGSEAVLWGKRIVNRSQLDDGAQIDATQLLTTQDPYRDPFHFYADKFSVFVPACYGASQTGRRSLLNLINAERPAGTQAQLVFVGPRFRIGFQSTIGLDAVVGRYPQGVSLDGAALGQGTVLSDPPERSGGPSFEIGREARIGSTTRLD